MSIMDIYTHQICYLDEIYVLKKRLGTTFSNKIDANLDVFLSIRYQKWNRVSRQSSTSYLLIMICKDNELLAVISSAFYTMELLKTYLSEEIFKRYFIFNLLVLFLEKQESNKNSRIR